MSRLQLDQDGVITRAQARACGLTEGDIRWALARTWMSLQPGIYQLHRGPIQHGRRMMAAQLYAGDDAVITGAAACRWRGLEHVPQTDLVEVVVPGHCSSRRMRWAEIRRSTIDPGLQRSGPLHLASMDRAVVDAARRSRSDELATALILEAVQRRLTTVDRLAHVNDALGRRHSAIVTRALAEAAHGAWSVPEAQLARLVATSRVLPAMWTNPELTAVGFGADGRAVRLITPDGWFDDVALAVMVHSRRFHDGPSWAATVERDGELTSYGVVVCQVTPASLEKEAAKVLAFLERTYTTTCATRARPAHLSARRWAAG